MENILQPGLPFTVILLLLLLLSRLAGELFERIGQPAMIGEILAGMLLGPSVLNIITYSDDLKILSDFGVFLLMILAGFEVNPVDARNAVRGRSALIAVMGFFIPLLSGVLIGLTLGLDWLLTLFIGLCLSITALSVSVRILMDLGKLNTDIGQKIISAAIFTDVVSFMILGIILDSNQAETTVSQIMISVLLTILKVSLFVLLIFFAYKTFQLAASRLPVIQTKIDRLLEFLKGKESLFALIIVFVLLFASASELLGLHFIIGAFFGAMLLNHEFLGEDNFAKVRNSTSGITMGFLAPIFFAGMGLQFSLSSINDPWLLILVLIASFASKIVGGYFGARLSGLGRSASYTLGVGLNARGIMELVIANIALQNGFINLSVYSVLVLMGIVTTLVSPYLLKRAFDKMDLRESAAGVSFSAGARSSGSQETEGSRKPG